MAKLPIRSLYQGANKVIGGLREKTTPQANTMAAQPVKETPEQAYARKKKLLEDEEREKMQRDRQEGRQYADDVLSKPQEGLTPQQRQGLQERANKQISADVDQYDRRIRSSAGAAGVRGGAVTGHKLRLANQALGAQQDVQRDLNELDAATAMSKLAARIGLEQGFTAQGIGARQQAADEVLGQRALEKAEYDAFKAANQPAKKRKWWQVF